MKSENPLAPKDLSSVEERKKFQEQISLEKCVSSVGAYSAFTSVFWYGAIQNVRSDDYIGAALCAAVSILPAHQLLGWYRATIRNYKP